jgi:hypothetical protein
MNTLSQAQEKLAALRAEAVRIDGVLAQSGAAAADVEAIRAEIHGLESSAHQAASEWAVKVIGAGDAGTGGPPMPASTGAMDVLRDRLLGAERRASVEEAARAPLKARRDQIRHEVWVAEAAVDKATIGALIYQGHRLGQELGAALAIAKGCAEKLYALHTIVGPEDAKRLPAMHPAVDALGVNAIGIERHKSLWRGLMALLGQMPEATLEDAVKFREFQAARAAAQ